MPISDAYNKADRHYQLQKLFSLPGQRLRTSQIAEKFGVSEDTIKKDIDELSLSGRLPLRKDGQFWILAEDARLESLQVGLTFTEAAALFLAGRLLSQMHDERNEHVIMALTKLIDAMPKTLAHHQHSLVDMARQRQQGQEDKSAIFNAIALGWAKHRKVRLLYAPPRKRKFECLFSPYLLEPSAMGKTFYAIGDSTPPNSLRTYKMERIEFAELTDESFEIPENFDGPTLLAKAWGVMYGDEEPMEVKLRFSHWVTKRVKETLWHPSQIIKDTEAGCELTVQIGDITEIKPWIRSWGADCEVLAPPTLHKEIKADVHRLARLYRVSPRVSTALDEPDEDLFNSFFGE